MLRRRKHNLNIVLSLTYRGATAGDLQLQEPNRVDADKEEQSVRDEKIPQSCILRQQPIRAQDYHSGRCRIHENGDRLEGKNTQGQDEGPKVALSAVDATHKEDSRHGRPS